MTRAVYYALAVVLLCTAVAARAYRLDHQSFWNDEGNSARLSERTIPLILEGTASDVHPPLYYLMLRGWRELAGETEFGLRSLSAFAGILTVAATMALGRVWFGRTAALIAGAITALSPPLIYYSQEARMYSLLALLAVLSTLFLWRWLHTGQHFNRWALAYLFTAAAGLYTHYAFPAVLVVHNLAVGLHALTHRRRFWPLVAHWAGLMAATLLLYAPWLPIFLRAGGRATDPTPLTSFAPTVAHWLLVGPTLPTAPAVVWPLLGLAGLGWGIRLWRRTPRNLVPAAVAFLWLLLPATGMAAVGATTANYLKFLVVSVPAAALLVGGGLVGWGDGVPRTDGRMRQRLRWGMAAVGLTLFVNVSSPAISNLYFNPDYFRDDYRAIARQIEADGYPNAGILLNAPNQWEVFTYYYDGRAAVYPFPTYVMPPEQIEADLAQMAAEHDRLYGLFWGGAGFDPQGTVERWLDANGYKAVEEWRGDVRFVMYALPPQPPTEMETAVNAAVGGEAQMTLVGYTLPHTAFRPGDVLTVSLFWRAERDLDERYKIFLHLLDENGRLVAQRDAEPQGNLAPTDGWPVGERIPDNHGVLVPADAAPGRYTLRVGVYPLTDPGRRLPITPPGGQPADGFTLAEVTVTE